MIKSQNTATVEAFLRSQQAANKPVARLPTLPPPPQAREPRQYRQPSEYKPPKLAGLAPAVAENLFKHAAMGCELCFGRGYRVEWKTDTRVKCTCLRGGS